MTRLEINAKLHSHAAAKFYRRGTAQYPSEFHTRLSACMRYSHIHTEPRNSHQVTQTCRVSKSQKPTSALLYEVYGLWHTTPRL